MTRRLFPWIAAAITAGGIAGYLTLSSNSEPSAPAGVATIITVGTTTPGTTTTSTTTVLTVTTESIPAPANSDDCDLTCVATTGRLTDLIDPALEGGTFGFLLREVDGGTAAEYNASLAFYPASAIKTVHLVQALSGAPAGDELDYLDSAVRVYTESCSGAGEFVLRPLGSLLRSMMIDSNNQATNAIQDHFGLDALRATMTAASMDDSAIYHRFGCGGPANDPANTTTASDLATLYEAVVTGGVLPNPVVRAMFFDTIIDGRDIEVTPLGGGRPQRLGGETAIHVYLKEGWYERTLTAGGVIEFDGSRTFVYGAFVSGSTSFRPGFAITQVVAELVACAAERIDQ